MKETSLTVSIQRHGVECPKFGEQIEVPKVLANLLNFEKNIDLSKILQT